MKRDMILMLEILSYVEERPDVPPTVLMPKDFAELGKDLHTIALHIALLHEAGLIEMTDGGGIVRLTMAGYDYLYPGRSRLESRSKIYNIS